MKQLFITVIQDVYYVFRDALIEGITSIIAALFFIYFFGIGGIYLMFKRMENFKKPLSKIQIRDLDRLFLVNTIMTLFNIICWTITIYLIVKIAA